MSSLHFLFQKKYFFFAIFLVFGGISLVMFTKNFEISRKDAHTENAVENIEFKDFSPENPVLLSEFNPNDLSLEQWQNLGFSEKQSETILKYKKMLGGSFSSKEEFKKCYAVSDEKYQMLESFILLPENEKSQNTRSFSSNFNTKNSLRISRKFNPDTYSLENWMNIGFTENQAKSILKYKNYLGGSFQSKEKFSACFVISAENYQKLKPFLLLPEKVEMKNHQDSRSFATVEKPTIHYTVFDPNELDLEGWMKMGFSEKQASTILNFKNKFHKGSFKKAEDLAECYSVSAEKFEEMKPYITIKNTGSVSGFNSKKSNDIEEKTASTDFSSTDLNTITFNQLLEFGFNEKAAGSYLGFRKKLGGFVHKNQILETYNIDVEVTRKLLSIARLGTENIQKYHLKDAPETWLKEHPYFKYYADKIIFYRISFPDDKKILSKMKLKPEVEAKMKLYLLSQ